MKSKCNLPVDAVEHETEIDLYGRSTFCRYWSVGGEIVRAEVSLKQLNGKWKYLDITDHMCEVFWLEESLADDLANRK